MFQAMKWGLIIMCLVPPVLILSFVARFRVIWPCVSLMLVAILANDADACRRCGLFGNRCKFVAHQAVVAQPVVVQQPQTVILQANYAAQPLGVLGNTGYGFSGVTAPYGYLDKQLALNQLARLSQNLIDGANTSLAEFRSALEASVVGDAAVASILARGQAATSALQAAGGELAQARSQTVTIKIDSNGQASIVPNGRDADSDKQNDHRVIQPPQEQLTSALQLCVKCHNNDRASGDFRLSGSLDSVGILKALSAIKQDRMPPKSEMASGTQRQEYQLRAIEELFELAKE